MRCIKTLFAMAFSISILGCSFARAETIRVGGIGASLSLLQALGEGFARHSPADRLEIVPGLGSNGALAATAAGALSLAISGRALSAAEEAQGLVAMPFGETPLVFVHSGQIPLDMPLADIVRAHGGTLDKVPSGEPLRLILRPANDSATVYIATAIPGMAEALEQARRRTDLPIAATDQDNMDMLRRIPGAFASMTLAQLAMEPNALQRVRVAGVEPSVEMMKQGKYSYKLGMTLVVKAEPAPVVKRFFDYLATADAIRIFEKAGMARTP